MVLLILTLEFLLSTIGSAIGWVLSFVFAFLPYALAALPIYILYRAARAVWPKLRSRLRRRRKPVSKTAVRAKAPARKAMPSSPLHVRAEAPPPSKSAAGKPPLARTYGEGMDILARQMRGPLRRGDIPWFLAFGVGGPALLATDASHVSWPEDGNTENGCWWFCEGAAILHAGADSADGSKLDASWPSLVAAMRKRPMRRPLDGILLMVGADELRAAAEREAPRKALAKRAEALRARLRAIRDDLGMVCPVHVVVVRAESLEGFGDLCAAIPATMLDSVLGWTSPHDWLLPFEPGRVGEAFDAMQSDLALLESNAFAAGTAGVRLPLLAPSLDTLRHPLALFLDGALGGAGDGNESGEPFPLRGIALTGACATATGGRRPAFARDLLPGRAFAEPGYGRPSETAFLQGRRRRRMAQATLAASAAVLSVAAWQGFAIVSAGTPAVAASVGDLRRALLSRDAVADGPMAGRVIAATAAMERDRLATPLLPTSLFSGFDEDKRRLASVTLRRAVLRPIRDALLPSATMTDLPPVTNARRVEDLPAFRRLAAQLDRIGGRRGALERYDRFRRNSGFDELLALAESVHGAVPRPPVTATDGFITRIAAGADLPNLDARTIAAAVRAESVQLAAPLAEELYTRNPLLLRGQALADRLRDLPQPPAAEDVEDTRKLVAAVTEVAGWPIAAALQDPSRGLPDAIKLALQKAAIADLPGRDTTDRITEALSTAATSARAAVLALEAPQVGRLLASGEGGALTLSPTVAALPGKMADALPAPTPDSAPAPAAAKPGSDTTKASPPPTQAAVAKPAAPEAKPVESSTAPSVAEPHPANPPARPPEPTAVVEANRVAANSPAPVLVEPPPPIRLSALPVPAAVPSILEAEPAVTKLAALFSQTLAGRFPFVHPDLARGTPDADPQDVRRFFAQLDENRAAVTKTATPELAAFLERMEAARPLLEAVFRSTPVSVRFTYGTNRAQEHGAEHIIDWSIRSGSGAVGASAGPAPLTWKAGQPLLLSFRWAAGSPYRPKNATASEAEAAAGDTLTLVERGPWALLRLLRSRSASVASTGDGTLLRIALPTQTIGGEPVRDTVLFVTASVGTGSRSSVPAQAFDLPVRFPQR
ncbi:type VI secretion protein IcmF/TssM N-terminal domain-containing protein [Azospirillum sp.]|uniref:type VI secretion protein IcmF/TssM N-terminal domain-containing protein n=1 Tax=Azospirillum sp. TaxID=34012 RepID=UPI002D4B232F|nr:type VI secretion protein IcmF/TssM N-terminal domain-containing protein [Azospirillum sp.]HYF90014.1 type VI secretion protein IcmF/TssM N-terminal domain-containing protein [Azospirillum sp.]